MTVVAALSLAGCVYDGHEKEPINKPSTDTTVQVGISSSTQLCVIPFVDVSKGMAGYYSGHSATQFKTDVWSVLKKMSGKWGTDSVILLSEKNPIHEDINTFREKMNAGKLLYDNNTSIPQMLEKIVSQIGTTEGMVAVLISDMKYSPQGDKSPEALKAQYSTDISSILSKDNIAASLICAVSNYKAGKSCDHSPYYYLVLGDPQRIASVRNAIVGILKESDSFVEVSESGVEYGRKLAVRHESAKGAILLDKTKLVYGGYDSRVADTVSITLGIGLRQYPQFLWDSDTLKSYITVKPSGYAKCYVSEIEVQGSMAFLTINVYNLKEKNQKIAINLGGFNPSLARSIDHFFGAEKESECDKTLLIDQFIRGLSDKRNQKSSVEILITKENKI